MITFPYCWVLHVFFVCVFVSPNGWLLMNTFHLFVFSASQHQPIFLFYSAFLFIIILFFLFYFIFLHAINRALRCWFRSGNVLCLNMVSSYLELGSASIICPDTPHMKKKEKKREAYGGGKRIICHMSWVCPMFPNVFKCVWFDWPANRMAAHVFSGIHSFL